MDPRQSCLHSLWLQNQLKLAWIMQRTLLQGKSPYFFICQATIISTLGNTWKSLACSALGSWLDNLMLMWKGKGKLWKCEAVINVTSQCEESEWCQEEPRWKSFLGEMHCFTGVHTLHIPLYGCFLGALLVKLISVVCGRCGLHWEMPKQLSKSLLPFKG